MNFEEWWEKFIPKSWEKFAIAKAAWNESPRHQWRPIESAPKDGTLIDLWAECWDANGKMVFRRIPNCHWYEDKNRSGWVGLYSAEYPTHWMPIPEPPEEK